jgi:hypothetical protein
MAGQGKRLKLADPEKLLHTGGISMTGLKQIMKIAKECRLSSDSSAATYSSRNLRDANSMRSAVMFEHMQHCGTNVFNQSHNHVIHC